MARVVAKHRPGSVALAGAGKRLYRPTAGIGPLHRAFPSHRSKSSLELKDSGQRRHGLLSASLEPTVRLGGLSPSFLEPMQSD